jgi:DNA-binding MarR family transcriptional regulator
VFELRLYLPYLLNRTGSAVADAFADALAEASLTVPAWRVLAVLLRDDLLRIGELAELTSIEFSTLSRLVGTLERRGFVVRKGAKDDARVVNVALTARGRAIANRLLPAAVELERRLVEGMSAAEVSDLRRLLGQLYENI